MGAGRQRGREEGSRCCCSPLPSRNVKLFVKGRAFECFRVWPTRSVKGGDNAFHQFPPCVKRKTTSRQKLECRSNLPARRLKETTIHDLNLVLRTLSGHRQAQTCDVWPNSSQSGKCNPEAGLFRLPPSPGRDEVGESSCPLRSSA